MSKVPPGKKGVPIDVFTNKVTICMALLFSLPSLGIFLGIYYTFENLLIGAVLGFIVHFVILAFAGRISKRLDEIMN
jgi:flagellar biosynthesis protein FliR